MKTYITFFLLLFLITTVSCHYPIKEKPIVFENQPIVSYITSYTDNNTPILVYEHGVNTSNVIRNLRYGRICDSIYRKDAPEFVVSDYYNKHTWEIFVKEYSNDTILKSWNENDFTFDCKIIKFKRLEKQFHRSNVHITRGKFYRFSDILYYDNKKYAIFIVSARESMSFVDGKKNDEAVIIMKKENGIWKLVDKVRIDPFIIFLD